MARLASNEKMGFYPTPEKSLYHIKQFIKAENPDNNVTCLDPCCGEGVALNVISTAIGNCYSYGVELDIERAIKSQYIIDKVLQGSIFNAQIKPLGCFGLLYLNPPYESEEGERVEIIFLKHSIRWLSTKGLLIFIVPENIFAKSEYREWIGQHFRDIQIYRLHRDDFPRFKQVVLFGYKRSSRVEDGEDIQLPPYRHIEDIDEINHYIVPITTGPTEQFQIKEAVTEEEVHANWLKLITELEKIRGRFFGSNQVNPLFPLRKGHLVALLTAGAFDGRIDIPGGFLVIKGFSERVKFTRTEDDKEITTDTYNVCVRLIEKIGKVARWYDIK